MPATTTGSALTEAELLARWHLEPDSTVIRAAVEKGLMRPAIKLSSFAKEENDGASPASDTKRLLLTGLFYVYESTPLAEQPSTLQVTAVICAEKGSKVDGQDCTRFNGNPSRLRLIPSEVLKTPDELLYTAAEANRLAQVHSLEPLDDRPAEGGTDSPPLGVRERHNLLKLIGALAGMYLQKAASPRLGTVDQPNLNQISNAIQSFLAESRVSDAGLRARTLNENLSKAFEALDNDKL